MAKQDVTVELFYDSQWNTAPVYTRDGIRLTHGRRDEETDAPPSSCGLTLDNRDGAYNPRNPQSALYGKIGRNTPLRVTVDTDVRFAGEVAQWQPRRGVSAADAWVLVEANGVTRRLGQGASVAPSVVRAYIPTLAESLDLAYWALEDGPQAVAPAATAGSGGRMYLRGKPSPDVWGQGKLAPWLPGVAKIEHPTLGAVMQAPVQMTGFVDRWTLDFMRSGGYSDTVGGTVFGVHWRASGGTAKATGLTFNAQDSELDLTFGFSTLATAAIDPALWDDNPHHVRLTAIQDGADIDYQVWIDGVSELTFTDTGETLGPISSVQAAISVTVETALATGHWVVYATAGDLGDAVDVAFGRAGEAAGRRIERLCDEQGIAFDSTGDLDDTSPVGPQYTDPLLTLLRDAAAVDLGILVDDPEAVGLAYRTRTSLYDQAAVLELDFDGAEIAPTLDAAVDDQQVRNDVTVSQRSGGEYQAVDEDGPLGVDAIGRYDTSVTLNVPGDGFLASHAGWRLHLGTVDEDRWPKVSVDLDAAPALAVDVSAVRVGDRIDLVNLPDTIAAAGSASLLVQGWTEDVGSHRRVVTFVCTPETPWRVGTYEDAVGDPGKYDTAGSELDIGVNSTHTALAVEVTTGPLWTTDDDETPFDIAVGGERMTVTDIGAAAADVHVFTVTRSVNGVVKSHAAGTPVRLWAPTRYTL
jgi:hypothetical protein